MRLKTAEGDTFGEVYRQILRDLTEDPDFVTKPRGLEVKEIVGYRFRIRNPRSRLIVCDRRSTPMRYLLAELAWYASLDRSAAWIEQYASLWGKIADDRGMVNSQYGHLVFADTLPGGYSMFDYAVKCLELDPDSRKAVILYNRPELLAVDTKDTVCTFFNQLLIRDGKLHMVTSMRSSDVVFGLTFDVPWFTLVQEAALCALRPFYPDLELGEYIHTSQSLHLYQKDYDLAEEMLGSKWCDEDAESPPMEIFPLPDMRKLRLVLEREETSSVIRDPAIRDLAERYEREARRC